MYSGRSEGVENEILEKNKYLLQPEKVHFHFNKYQLTRYFIDLNKINW